MGAAYLLPRLIGLGRATELLVLGDEVSADRAYEIGLATRVVDDDSLPTAATDLARRLADGPALAYATTKILLTREIDMGLSDAIEMEALAQALLMKSDDFARVLRGLVGGEGARVARPVIVNPPELPEPVGFAHAVVAGGARLPRRPDRRGRLARRAVRLGRRRSSSPRCAPPAASPTSSSRSSSTRRTSRSTARRRASWARSGAGTSAGATRRWR